MGMPAWGAVPYPYAGPTWPAVPAEAEMDALKAQAGYLEQTLQALRQRIQKLESEAKPE
jgi:ubiquinone biosynthesis protein UbiJ